MDSVIILFNLWIARDSKTDSENNNPNISKPHLKNIAFYRIFAYIICKLIKSKQLGYSITIMPFRFVYHILKALTENNKACACINMHVQHANIFYCPTSTKKVNYLFNLKYNKYNTRKGDKCIMIS